MPKIIFFFFAFILFSAHASESNVLVTPKGGNFSISTTADKNFQLSDLRGKTVFLFFGFTRCPHVCPITIQRINLLKKQLEKEKIENVHFLFISVDNERDTPEILKSYAESNGKLFSAGSADERKLREIISSYGGYFSKLKSQSGKIMIDHSSTVYVINPEGNWVDSLNYDRPYQDYYDAYKRASKNTQGTIQSNPRREMILIDGDKDCELGKSNCERILPDQSSVSISLSPKPVKTEKEMTISVTTKSKSFIPRDIDFVGVDQNMGLIRPSLKKRSKSLYQVKMTLPLCEVSKMKWKVRLIFQDSQSKLYYSEYLLITED